MVSSLRKRRLALCGVVVSSRQPPAIDSTWICLEAKPPLDNCPVEVLMQDRVLSSEHAGFGCDVWTEVHAEKSQLNSI